MIKAAIIDIDMCEQETLLNIGGNLTVENGVTIKKALTDAFSLPGHVHLMLRDIGAIDFSFIQILYAAQTAASSDKRMFRVSGPDFIIKAVTHAGFSTALKIHSKEDSGHGNNDC